MPKKRQAQFIRNLCVDSFDTTTKKHVLYRIVFEENSDQDLLSDDTKKQVVIWKRYKEIRKLYEVLSTYFNRLPLSNKPEFPPLSPPTFFGRRDNKTISDRQQSIEKFLRFVFVDTDILRQHELAQDFLASSQLTDEPVSQSCDEQSTSQLNNTLASMPITDDGTFHPNYLNDYKQLISEARSLEDQLPENLACIDRYNQAVCLLIKGARQDPDEDRRQLAARKIKLILRKTQQLAPQSAGFSQQPTGVADFSQLHIMDPYLVNSCTCLYSFRIGFKALETADKDCANYLIVKHVSKGVDIQNKSFRQLLVRLRTVRHRNLVALDGFSEEQRTFMLVFRLPNGSMDYAPIVDWCFLLSRTESADGPAAVGPNQTGPLHRFAQSADFELRLSVWCSQIVAALECLQQSDLSCGYFPAHSVLIRPGNTSYRDDHVVLVPVLLNLETWRHHESEIDYSIPNSILEMGTCTTQFLQSHTCYPLLPPELSATMFRLTTVARNKNLPNGLATVRANSEQICTAVNAWSLGQLLFLLATGRTVDAVHPYGLDLHSGLRFPQDVSPSTALEHFLNGLLVVDPLQRLGGSSCGFDEIKQHPFLTGSKLSL